MGFTVRGSNPGGGEIFCAHPDRPCSPLSLLCNGYHVFPGGKERPGMALNTHPSSSVKVKEWAELYLYSPLAFVACSRVNSSCSTDQEKPQMTRTWFTQFKRLYSELWWNFSVSYCMVDRQHFCKISTSSDKKSCCGIWQLK